MKCVINPKMQVIYARNVYCSRGANLRDVTARMDGLSRVEGPGYNYALEISQFLNVIYVG